MDARKRWMALAVQNGGGWTLSVQPVGEVSTLLPRLLHAARGGPVALGLDLPLGLPAAFARLHCAAWPSFPAFLRALPPDAPLFGVADALDQVSPTRPFYPRRGVGGMSRLSHARALGLEDAAALSRLCDRATPTRPAGAPLFWTLGANQSGKAALSGWRHLVVPALLGPQPPLLWPFDGPFRQLLHPGRAALAETYPAEALRQLGLRLVGSKRRQADRLALMPGLLDAMARLRAEPDPALRSLMATGCGADAAGEDRLDCLLGVLCVLQVVGGERTDEAPDTPAIRQWEGWVLGQSAPAPMPASPPP